MTKILSIQSHVVHGYVGNKAATYPLQCLGYDVLPLNTVQFSNHTGYGRWSGEVFAASHILDIVEQLEELGILEGCIGILSGYMGSRAICEAVQYTAKRVKELNPSAIYLCDPVMGNNSCFVAEEVQDFFCNFLSAEIITPNMEEAQILTKRDIKSMEDVLCASELLLKNSSIVIITGLRFKGDAAIYVSLCTNDGLFEHYKTHTFDFQLPPNGTGDLFSALFLGYYLEISREYYACKENDVGIMTLSKDSVTVLSKGDIARRALLAAINGTNDVLLQTFTHNSRELRILDTNYRIFLQN